MTDEERYEILEEMREDWKKELWEEEQLRLDEDFALNKYAFEIETAYDILRNVCDSLDQYGWEFTPTELIDML